MNYYHESDLRTAVEQCAREVTEGLNQERNLPLNYDQTKGNLCHLLTYYAFGRLTRIGLVLRRELHIDDAANWHYLLVHDSPEIAPTDTDIVSDLNPWQWRDYGSGILHGPRHEVINTLRENGAPENVVALRGLRTISNPHHMQLNPFTK